MIKRINTQKQLLMIILEIDISLQHYQHYQILKVELIILKKISLVYNKQKVLKEYMWLKCIRIIYQH